MAAPDLILVSNSQDPEPPITRAELRQMLEEVARRASQPKPFWTMHEFAELMGCTVDHVKRLQRQGKLLKPGLNGKTAVYTDDMIKAIKARIHHEAGFRGF